MSTRGCLLSSHLDHGSPPRKTLESCSYIDRAINFRGHNWPDMMDAFFKYTYIHLMYSISTARKLDEDFAHFGYPHTIATYNANCFSSAEFQRRCEQRNILKLHGAFLMRV
ncbi:transposon tf2-9 polyprotein [Plakobranchus ocellatus]|uniref:Transposon tf2-9 polyprotein n=1 Tax=Plakobranchus ocellatus TaxID=259542 RepID=A0AAV3Y310_9GAST|nr:transposon tf2-9 polyprotein [Plakobranchus ocellatus]